MIDRRTFIGGCVATGVAAGLPKAPSPYTEYTESLSRGLGPTTITIPAGALILFGPRLYGGGTAARAHFLQDGREYVVECDVIDPTEEYPTIRNTGRVLEIKPLPEPGKGPWLKRDIEAAMA